jgi:hypothetical protein
MKSPVQFGRRRDLKPRGGTGGSPGEKYCSDDEVIIAIKPWMVNTSGTPGVVQSLDFICTSVQTHNPHTMSFGPGLKDAGGPNALLYGPLVQPLQQCPDGEVASGIEVRYGKYVNAIGLICDKFSPPKEGEGGSSKNFVAVAGDQKGRWSISVGYSAKTKASAAAMKDCGSGCKILHENQAKCAAVAESKQSPAVWGVTSANTLDEAKSGALAGCDKNAPGQCKIVDNSRCG